MKRVGSRRGELSWPLRKHHVLQRRSPTRATSPRNHSDTSAPEACWGTGSCGPRGVLGL